MVKTLCKLFYKLIHFYRDCDEEILRNLYGRAMNDKLAYEAMVEKHTFQETNYPVKINKTV